MSKRTFLGKLVWMLPVMVSWPCSSILRLTSRGASGCRCASLAWFAEGHEREDRSLYTRTSSPTCAKTCSWLPAAAACKSRFCQGFARNSVARGVPWKSSRPSVMSTAQCPDGR